MANNTIQKIESTILEFTAEIHKFQSLIEYIDRAKEAITIANNSQNKSIDVLDQKARFLMSSYSQFEKLASNADHVGDLLSKVDFPARLDNIEETVKNTITIINKNQSEAVHELNEAKKSLKQIDLKIYADLIAQSIDKAIGENKKVLDKISNFNIDKDLNAFEKKISNNLTGGILGLQKEIEAIKSYTENLNSAICDLESFINESSKELLKKQDKNNSLVLNQISILNDIHQKLEISINEISKKQNLNNNITIILLVIVVVTSLLGFVIK